jgi:hypothetical protein
VSFCASRLAQTKFGAVCNQMPLRICCTENHERRPWRTRRSRSSLSVARAPPGSAGGAQARFDLMGLARLGLEIGTLCDSLYSILLLNVILGLDFLGLLERERC